MQLIYCDKKQASGCLKMGKKGWKKWQQDYKTAGENLGGDEYTHYFHIINIIVMISWLYTCAKTY